MLINPEVRNFASGPCRLNLFFGLAAIGAHIR
jgi:hypothetical protein